MGQSRQPQETQHSLAKYIKKIRRGTAPMCPKQDSAVLLFGPEFFSGNPSRLYFVCLRLSDRKDAHVGVPRSASYSTLQSQGPARLLSSQHSPRKWHIANSMNISVRGVYFKTTHPVFVGLPVRVQMQMPSQCTGKPATHVVFTGRISHVATKRRGQRISGVGVEFFFNESF
jgi:hypothetical protein